MGFKHFVYFNVYFCVLFHYSSFLLWFSCERKSTIKSKHETKMTKHNIGIGAEAVDTPAIDNCTTIYSYKPNLYIKDGSDDFEQLRNEQVIRDFANIKPDTYELIKNTNKTLTLFIDLAKRICEVEG